MSSARPPLLLLVLLAVAGCNAILGEHDFASPVDAPPPPPSMWQSLAVGIEHGCGIHADDRSLWCWGRNDAGELGVPITQTIETDVPVRVDTSAYQLVAVAFQRTCAIRTDQSLWCWGYDLYGETGAAPTANQISPPTQIPGTWSGVATGFYDTCAIDAATGGLACFGTNQESQLATASDSNPHPTPVPIARGTAWRSVTVGVEAVCGIQVDGSAWCWGGNSFGEAASTSTQPLVAPTRIDTNTWLSLAAGNYFTCGVRDTGHLLCWGYNATGQLGNSSTVASAVPTAVGFGQEADWVEVAAGGAHACARNAAGAAQCWGDNRHAQLANPALADPFASAPHAVPLPGDFAVARLATGGDTTCFLAGDGRGACAGIGGDGQRGDGIGSVTAPVQVMTSVAKFSTGSLATCAIDTTGMLACWGAGTLGEIGDGLFLDRQVPAHPIATPAIAVAATTHTCILEPDGKPACWGDDDYGQLGSGTPGTFSSQPVAVTAMPAAIAIATSVSHTCAIDTNGNLYCWGDNLSGQSGEPSSMSVPPSLVAAASVAQVALARQATCLVTAGAREVRCFGDNVFGELGSPNPSGSLVMPTSPPQVGVDEIAMGDFHGCARAGETVTCWGRNTSGELGLGSTNGTAPPTAIAGAWLAIAAGGSSTCGVKTDRTLWCWGANARGGLGTGDRVVRTEPAQVGTATDWTAVRVGATHACATRDDQSLWCWGGDSGGELGIGAAWTANLTTIR